jgi:hypothetical protein
MADKTILAIPGRKVPVPRAFKRTLQITVAVALTAAAVFVLMAGNGLLQAKGTLQKVIPVWLAFVSRSDILATMILTAIVTVFFIYWQRDTERR